MPESNAFGLSELCFEALTCGKWAAQMPQMTRSKATNDNLKSHKWQNCRRKVRAEKDRSKDSLHISFLDCIEKSTRICHIFSYFLLDVGNRGGMILESTLVVFFWWLAQSVRAKTLCQLIYIKGNVDETRHTRTPKKTTTFVRNVGKMYYFCIDGREGSMTSRKAIEFCFAC